MLGNFLKVAIRNLRRNRGFSIINISGLAIGMASAIGVFVVSGIIGLSIALLTVSYQAVRAAVANPVKSLRTE
jgi:NAD(P)-dependent dehydrogenase (short-subunit alcohol dehydrogenase family)